MQKWIGRRHPFANLHLHAIADHFLTYLFWSILGLKKTALRPVVGGTIAHAKFSVVRRYFFVFLKANGLMTHTTDEFTRAHTQLVIRTCALTRAMRRVHGHMTARY